MERQQEVKRWIEKQCALSSCEYKTFKTRNPRAKYCCDAHRYQGFLERHAAKILFMKKWQTQFKMNAEALKHLYNLMIFYPTERDLKIAGFDFTVRDAERRTPDGRTAFAYFNFIIATSVDGKLFEIIHKLKK